MQNIKEVLRNEFNSKHGDIARYVYHYPGSYKTLTTTKVISNCHVSAATITRFVKKIGLNNFNELKYFLVYSENAKHAPNQGMLLEKLLDFDELRLHEQIVDIIQASSGIALLATVDYQNLGEELYYTLHQFKPVRMYRSASMFVEDYAANKDTSVLICIGNMDHETLKAQEANEKLHIINIGLNREMLLCPERTNITYLKLRSKNRSSLSLRFILYFYVGLLSHALYYNHYQEQLSLKEVGKEELNPDEE